MKILIVDDSRTILMMIAYVLKQNGHEAITQPTAEKAFGYLKDNSVDLIVTDINMPGLGGEALIHQVKSTPQLSHIPIIVCSTSSDAQALEGTYFAWLNKPLQPEKLLQAIEKMTSTDTI